jgi:sulfur-oxidizing protein SoxX
LSKTEISYGTIGPSLYNYGKNQGNTPEALKTAWAKIYNSKASNACSNMPRAGHKGIITEKQIQDLMALLFDPNSPVNQ